MVFPHRSCICTHHEGSALFHLHLRTDKGFHLHLLPSTGKLSLSWVLPFSQSYTRCQHQFWAVSLFSNPDFWQVVQLSLSLKASTRLQPCHTSCPDNTLCIY